MAQGSTSMLLEDTAEMDDAMIPGEETIVLYFALTPSSTIFSNTTRLHSDSIATMSPSPALNPTSSGRRHSLLATSGYVKSDYRLPVLPPVICQSFRDDHLPPPSIYMVSVPSPQRAAITELTGSRLSVTAFWLILYSANAPAIYFYLIPRFWPGYIVASTLERCKEAKGSLKDIPLERLTDQQRVMWDQICCLVEKIHDLCGRDYQTRQGGFGALSER
ncbi:hypothetical protein BDZ89DRAFT_1141533 [Hymenopellis radicata]|nr:hypothetical protein BDZ89DRAFT_1141533 [Hymenopellis radicata]